MVAYKFAGDALAGHSMASGLGVDPIDESARYRKPGCVFSCANTLCLDFVALASRWAIVLAVLRSCWLVGVGIDHFIF